MTPLTFFILTSTVFTPMRWASFQNIVCRIHFTLCLSSFHFKFQFIIFFPFFKVHQKWYKNGHLEKNHIKCSKLIFICSIHKHICKFQHLSTLREPTGDILCIVSTFRYVHWILRSHHNMHRMFLFFTFQ